MKMHNHIIIWVSVFVMSLVVNTAQADRVKDLTNVGGVRGNQLVGYGLVVGLAGTGDGKDPTFTGQSLKAILESLGVTTNPYDDYDLQQSRADRFRLITSQRSWSQPLCRPSPSQVR